MHVCNADKADGDKRDTPTTRPEGDGALAACGEQLALDVDAVEVRCGLQENRVDVG
jgi:hypothetical protein